MADDGAQTAKNVAARVWDWTGYRFIYKKKERSRSSEGTLTYTFFCAQNEKEVTKEKLHPDPRERRARIKMDRFPCNGYLRITVVEGEVTLGIRLTHHRAHCQYVDISIDDETKKLIDAMKDSPASAIWDRIMREYPSTEITRKQVYAH
ncbi:hypothetical protein DFH07DRAFT_758176 [Mycena maculata]|uniref:Uncharacterized protein n=1 Tax=Mycena maculata TaxID=230809 RepID=A0AAD7MP19_9AGAR|nr:hypothetical protein DFH07DRAFT_758176 [Mycena maculata]